MLRDARGIDNSCNQFVLPRCSGPEHAICLINGYYFFSVKINNFIIVFHQKLFVPCLSIQGKVFSISPMCWWIDQSSLSWPGGMGAVPGTLHTHGFIAPPACLCPCYSTSLPSTSSHWTPPGLFFSPFSLRFSSFHPFWQWALWKAHVPSQGFRVAWQRLRATSATVAGHRFAPQAPQPGRTINAFTFTFGSLASKITMPAVLLLAAPAPQTPEPTREGTSPQGDEKPQNWAARPGCHCQLMHPLPLDV